MKPLISVIVPVYNVEKYIHECIDSILNQTFTDFELILVNDGSTDKSGIICDQYEKIDNRIIVIHKQNGGQSTARNRGLDIAKGNYIGFVDSDDWIHEDMLFSMLESAIGTNGDIVSCNILLLDQNGNTKLYTKESSDYVYTKEQALKELYKNQQLNFSVCNKLFRSELFKDLKFTEGIIFEDMDLIYKLIDKVTYISYIHRAFYYYRYNSGSTLRGSFSLKRLDEYYVKRRMYDFYLANYREISDVVYYYNVFTTGCRLYNLIYFNVPKQLKIHNYLIKFDKIILFRLLFKNYEVNISPKMKMSIIIYIFSPKLLLRLKRYHVVERV